MQVLPERPIWPRSSTEEQRTFNALAAGASPAGVTNFHEAVVRVAMPWVCKTHDPTGSSLVQIQPASPTSGST